MDYLHAPCSVPYAERAEFVVGIDEVLKMFTVHESHINSSLPFGVSFIQYSQTSNVRTLDTGIFVL